MGYAESAMAELHGDRIIDRTPPTIQQAYADAATEKTEKYLSGLRLTVAEISAVNLERALAWHKGGLEEWTISDWAVAMAGECGEVCDEIKKLRRIETNCHSENPRQPADREAALKNIAKEIGDTFLYLDLLAQRCELNIENCIRDTFNRVSIREKLPQRL